MIKSELVWEFDRIAQIASNNLRPVFNAEIPGFKDINAQFGSPLELKNQLALLGKGDHRDEKWPFWGLYLPYNQEMGGEYEIVSLTMIMAMHTSPNYLSRDRQSGNFEKILLPMYREGMRQFARSKFFVVMDPIADMPHRMTQHDYYGKDTTSESKRVLHDYADVVLIQDLRLKLSNSKHCC